MLSLLCENKRNNSLHNIITNELPFLLSQSSLSLSLSHTKKESNDRQNMKDITSKKPSLVQRMALIYSVFEKAIN